jgi:DTW domain-containing protein YfiP
VSKGTARLLKLAIPSVTIYHGEDAKDFFPVMQKLQQASNSGQSVALLYPSEKATPIFDYHQRLPKDNLLDHLVVIDGTWRKAFKIYQQNRWLDNYSSIKLSDTHDSKYVIRKTADNQSRSTLEAVAETLNILSGTDTSPLYALFNGMIEQQMQNMPAAVKIRYEHRKSSKSYSA